MYTATHNKCIIQSCLTSVPLLEPYGQHSGCDPISKCAAAHTILPNSLPNLLQRCLHDLKKKDIKQVCYSGGYLKIWWGPI